METSPKKVILVVDDDLNMRIFVSTLLETSGYVPIVSRDGMEGLKKAREFSPVLIILDIMMPGEGGVLMYRHLKQDEKLKDVPVLMLSGVQSGTFLHSLKMSNVGVKDALPEPEGYLEKPPKAEELLKTVRSLLKEEERERS
jgi:two-component system phosphate regulon response regulator PhoB